MARAPRDRTADRALAIIETVRSSPGGSLTGPARPCSSAPAICQAQRIGGDLGLRNLVNSLPADELELLDLPSAALDVDTSEDLEAGATPAARAQSGPRPGRRGG